MAIRCTISKAGVVNEYGQALAIGTIYTPNNDDYALALISQGKATDTDDFLEERVNAPFDEVVYPLDPVGLSSDGTSLVSGDEILPASWCLGVQHTAVTAPADTAENTLYSLTVPAGTMGLNDTLRISVLATVTNSANNKTLRVAFGGSNVSTFVVTTSAAVKTQHQLSNRNSLSSQIMGGATSGLSYGPSGVSALAVGTLSVDTSAAQTLTVTGQKATGAEVFTLESVVVELIRGPA